MAMNRGGTSNGLTLVESVLSIIIVGIMLVAALRTLGATALAKNIQYHQQTAARLAHELMAEIIPTDYEEPGARSTIILESGAGTTVSLDPSEGITTTKFGTETGESLGGTRQHFDDVDDYNGWSSSPPQTVTGATIANTTGWSRAVVVTWVQPATLAVSGVDTGLKLITVTVTDPRGVETTLVSLRSRASSIDIEPVDAKELVRTVGIDFQLGAEDEGRVNRSVHLLNQVAK